MLGKQRGRIHREADATSVITKLYTETCQGRRQYLHVSYWEGNLCLLSGQTSFFVGDTMSYNYISLFSGMPRTEALSLCLYWHLDSRYKHATKGPQMKEWDRSYIMWWSSDLLLQNKNDSKIKPQFECHPVKWHGCCSPLFVHMLITRLVMQGSIRTQRFQSREWPLKLLKELESESKHALTLRWLTTVWATQ